MTVPGDNPIRRTEEDLLGRSRPAAAFADQLLSLDASEGLVVGVLGPWGSGKTSFVNLARVRLKDRGIAVLDFNPWMFSGADQLVESFFIELASQLRMKPGLDEIGRDLEEYGETFSGLAWLPVVGPWIERGRSASKLLAKILQRRKEGVIGRRQKLDDALRALEDPLVVVLDDIDRLTTPEIRDIFKLIRLTANFPNIIYVVAFDRIRVEDALLEGGVPGRDYLEKILQVGMDLPAVPSEVLNRQVFEALQAAIDGIDPPAPFNEIAWLDAYMEVIRPLIRNMRDVRRYAASARGTLDSLDGRIELVDVLSLEALRVFLPDVFRALLVAVDGLTATSGVTYGGSGDPPHLKEQVERLVAAAGSDRDVVNAMIKRLFPAAQRHIGGSHYGPEWKSRWLRERRVAHEDVLRLYLERVVGDSLQSFVDAEQAWSVMGDREALAGLLRSLDVERLQDVISALETFESDFTPDQVVPAVTVLLNLMPELPERKRGMFDFDTRLVVGRVTYRLLRALPDEASVETAVREILPELTTLSAKLEMVSDVGHREGRGHQFVSEEVAADFERDWRDAVRTASVDDLIREPELLRILYLALMESEDEEEMLDIADDPRLSVAILQSAKSETRSQAMGSRAVRRSPRLAWDVLVQLFGSEDELAGRVDELKTSDIEVADDLVELFEKYRQGWRPDPFDEE